MTISKAKNIKKPTEPLKERIKDDLIKSGFPLEVFISNILQKKGWMVYNSALYVDPEDGSSREMDIHALKLYWDPTTGNVSDKKVHKVISHLIIQCKKSQKPWVFFDNADFPIVRVSDFLNSSQHEGFEYEVDYENDPHDLKRLSYIKTKPFKSFQESFTDPKNPSRIYESAVTAVKAAEYFKSVWGTGDNTINFFLPYVVVQGSFFSATVGKRDIEDVVLRDKKRLFLEFNFIKDKIKSWRGEKRYLINFVTQKDFLLALADLESDNKTLLKIWGRFLK